MQLFHVLNSKEPRKHHLERLILKMIGTQYAEVIKITIKTRNSDLLPYGDKNHQFV